MAQHNPHSIQLQINRLFENGQSLFATTKVEDWLKQRHEDPADYQIIFNKKPAPVGSRAVVSIVVDLQRKDGQPVDEWLLNQLNDIK
jgi:hypothetical protein